MSLAILSLTVLIMRLLSMCLALWRIALILASIALLLLLMLLIIAIPLALIMALALAVVVVTRHDFSKDVGKRWSEGCSKGYELKEARGIWLEMMCLRRGRLEGQVRVLGWGCWRRQNPRVLNATRRRVQLTEGATCLRRSVMPDEVTWAQSRLSCKQ